MTALVVGGTGMLCGFVSELVREGWTVGVVARRRRVEGTVPLLVDWHDSQALDRALSNFVQGYGPVHLAVCWIHSSAPEAPTRVAAAASGARYFQVYGSAKDAAQPVKRAWHSELSRTSDIRHRRIVLGSIGQRWLTHEEISAGVLRAVKEDMIDTVVGEAMTRWRQRMGEERIAAILQESLIAKPLRTLAGHALAIYKNTTAIRFWDIL